MENLKIQKITHSDLHKLYNPTTKVIIKTGSKRDMRKTLKNFIRGGEIQTDLLNDVIQNTYNQKDSAENLNGYELD